MTTPIGDSSLSSNTVTHNVDMITLSGPTNLDVMNPYQTTLNTIPIATGAHGSDFQTTPIEAYSSIFATQDGLLMDTIYDSGFNRSDMYIKDHPHQSHPKFKEFSRTDTSLKRISLDSPNFDSDGNKEFTFKDRAPYNIPARDNTVFGFDQPFILKDIGDRWGPGGLGAIDEGLFRGGFVTAAARTVADVLRIGKFLLTPKGIMFGLKQFGLQLLNPRGETMIWNPLSLGSVAPMIHIDRHLGGLTYETSPFGPAGITILDAYAGAIKLGPGIASKVSWEIIEEGMRTTNAHRVGMVPSKGGTMAIPAQPELGFDSSAGTINSLSKNILKVDGQDHDGLKTPYVHMDVDTRGGKKNHAIVGLNIYGAYGVIDFYRGESRDKRDPVYYKTRELVGTRSKHIQIYGGATGVKTLDTNWQFDTSLGIVKESGVFQGDLYAFSKADNIDKRYGKDYVYTGTVSDNHISITHKATRTVAYKGPKDDTAVGTKKTYTVDLEKPPVPIKIAGVFQGDYYNKEKNYLSTELTNQKGHYQIYGSGVISRERNNVIIPGGSVVSINHPTITTKTLALNGRYISQFTPIRLKRIVSGNTGRINFLGENKYGDSNVLEDTKESYVPTLILGQGKDGLLIPTDDQRNKLFTSKTYWGTSVINDTFKSDLYDKDKPYESQISSFGIVSSPPTKTRLRTDTEGDPTVTIKTPHRGSDPNTARLSLEGKYSTLEDIKLQDFPLINFTGDGNLGSERQSLGFVNKEITGLQGNLFGIPGKTRSGFGILEKAGVGNKKYTEIVPIKGKGTLQDNKDSVEYGKGLPFVSKTLAYEHKFAPDGIKDILEPNIDPDFKTIKTPTNLGPTFSTKTKGFTNQTGNILDKYKTLAYGEIPKSEEVDKKYGGKTEKTDDGKGGQYRGQAKDEVTTDKQYSVQYEMEDGKIGLGLVKKNADNTDYKYGSGTGIGEPDFVNMTKYGDDSDKPDYIKFKFYDIVNSKYIIFRAFLSGVSETLSPEWSSEKYIGRPDSVHVYQGVERSMSFEFMVNPSSKQELPILWEKMNYLVGLTYPSWRKVGTGKRMEAPFISLTIGDMYNAVPGFLSSLSITVDDNSPWELDEGFQLPHTITVGCEFTHIGQHALASQGAHFDFGGQDKTWLKPYNVGTGKMKETRPNGWDDTGLFSPTPQVPG